MRTNEPITQHEVAIPDGEPLVSRTDTAGRITFVNRVFAVVSGFSEQELIGQPHNLVRHPHMPPAVFADLWATIKAGRPWDGLVKNRAKSGDFYWVRANVTPIIEGGTVTGYVSIRSKPRRAQIATAEQAYAAMREGHALDVTLRDGELVRPSLRAKLVDAANSVRGRLTAATVAAVLALGVVGWLGFSGMAASNEVLRHVYEHDLVAVNQLRDVLDHIRDNRNLIAQLTVALARGIPPDVAVKEREPPVRASMAQITELWRAYTAADLTPDQHALAVTFAAAYAALVRDVVEPAFDLARRGEKAQLDALFQNSAPALFQATFAANRRLVDRQIAIGREAYTASVADLRRRAIIGAISALAGLTLVLALGWALLGTIRRCVRVFETQFSAIIRGDFMAEIASPAAREFRPMASMLRAMRTHLAFGGCERTENARRAGRARRETVDKMAVMIEQEAGAAIGRVAERTGAMAQDADAMAESAERVSLNAGHVAGAAGQALRNAQIVAAASEQLAASIREVAAQVEHASLVSRNGAEKGVGARDTIRSLSEAADRIGAVLRLIADIAGRTNLLALNATIEAARAGEAGKGFAVVASEVKSLATQTAKATGEISAQIAGLRGATEAAVTAVEDIGVTLDDVAQVAVSVSAAIEQQTAAAQEIARNVAESGEAVQEVARRISEVSHEATAVGEQAASLRLDSEAVSGEIASLRGTLVQTIRTATTDADRRMAQRVAVTEPCVVEFDTSRARIAGTILDVSTHGMLVEVADCGAEAGELGTLTLARRGDAQAGFEVRAVTTGGWLHIRFDPDSMPLSFKAAVETLLAVDQHAAAA